jgi:hypothetical protein
MADTSQYDQTEYGKLDAHSQLILADVRTDLGQEIIPIYNTLKDQGFNVSINNGMRSVATAQANVTSGVGILHSKHIYGGAVDMIDARVGWDLPADRETGESRKIRNDFWSALGAAVDGRAANGSQIRWGGHFTNKDVAHVELLLTYLELQAQYQANGNIAP